MLDWTVFFGREIPLEFVAGFENSLKTPSADSNRCLQNGKCHFFLYHQVDMKRHDYYCLDFYMRHPNSIKKQFFSFWKITLHTLTNNPANPSVQANSNPKNQLNALPYFTSTANLKNARASTHNPSATNQTHSIRNHLWRNEAIPLFTIHACTQNHVSLGIKMLINIIHLKCFFGQMRYLYYNRARATFSYIHIPKIVAHWNVIYSKCLERWPNFIIMNMVRLA